MLRCLFLIIVMLLSCETMEGHIIVVDSLTRLPLPGASIFDQKGRAIGITDGKGRLPYISADKFPVTISYLGFEDKRLMSITSDTIFLQENISELPEVVFESRNRKVLHILAYVREYSTLTTFRDTVYLFREKMVDYMLTPDQKSKFRGWSIPRVLTSKSYYRFTDDMGRDSVSDRSIHHFSWSDWIGVGPVMDLPEALRSDNDASVKSGGKYDPAEVWNKKGKRITVNVDVLADTTSRKWVSDLSVFFRKNIEFEQFKMRFDYEDVTNNLISPIDLNGYSFTISSKGRGHDMFRFNKRDEPFFVDTSAEVYILDKEYITVKEAKKWADHKFDPSVIGMLRPSDAPELQPEILTLIERVNTLDRDSIRLDVEPDVRLVSPHFGKHNNHIGRRALTLLKQVTGITYYKSHRNFNDRWNKFKKNQILENSRTDKKE